MAKDSAGRSCVPLDRTFFQFTFADSYVRGRPKTKGSLCEGQCLFYTAAWALLPVWLSEGCLSVLMKSIQRFSRTQTLEKALVPKPCLL